MHEREIALKEWLKQIIPNANLNLTPLTGDASFRRYYRLRYNETTQIVMDAPPDKEALKPFIQVAQILAQANVYVPSLFAMNLSQGFLILSDLGDTLLLNKLAPDTADFYYKQAIDTLKLMQQSSIDTHNLPLFDKTFMLKEMSLCCEWFFKNYLSIELNQEEIHLIQTTMNWIADEVASQPLLLIHRDYHSRNLMLPIEREGLAVIDFQDAMKGPLSYDLVSLLKDCYIAWPRDKVLSWATYFYEHNAQAKHYSLNEFIRAFDLCGLQRHLKVLGVFCRLYLRDGKAGYLADLPRTLGYVLECTETYEELHPFYNFLQQKVRLS